MFRKGDYIGKSKKEKNTFICCIVIIGVIIIPLLYSWLYLGAFWDPYAKLDELPVAVINLDKGVEINGKSRNLGNDMCDKLKEDGTLKFIFTDDQTAQKGIKEKSYYASITIPEDFSSCIASASSTDKHPAEISFYSNEKRNYLASQILSKAVLQIESEIRGDVNYEIVTQLCDQLKSAPSQLSALADGLGELSDGSQAIKNGTTELSDGTSQLKNGSAQLNQKTGEFSSGVNTAKNSAVQLLAGTKELEKGINKLTQGANQLDAATQNINELRTNAQKLAESCNTFNQGIIEYTDGVSSLIFSVETTSTYLTNYVKNNPSLMEEPIFAAFINQLSNSANAQNITALKGYTKQLQNASAQIAAGAKLLSDATTDIPSLKTGINELTTGLKSVQNGASQIVNGADQLKNGLGQLYSASSQINTATNKLAQGAEKVNSGASAINNGAQQLNNGIHTAKSEVNDTIHSTEDKLASLEGLPDFAKAPVFKNEEAVYPVANYGTAFAPYFLCLSLWVGALIMFFGIYFDPENKFKILSRNSDKKILRCVIYLLIGFIQAIVLGVVLKYCLGLAINNNLLYYFAICLFSLVSIAIVQFLLIFFKDAGKILAIVMLILQLTSCGGTFPMETVPKIFNILSPFMPMTYAVNLLKEAISGTASTYALQNSLVLIGILVVFIVLIIICGFIKNKNIVNHQLAEN